MPETRSDQQITPVSMAKTDRIVQAAKVTLSEKERSRLDPFQASSVPRLTSRYRAGQLTQRRRYKV